QGPVLDREGVRIGVVEGVQGISWTEFTIHGVSNHAGTTPMSMRNDAGFVAARVTTFVRELTQRYGGNQIATVGALTLTPNLVNVIPNKALFTVDLRNTDGAALKAAEVELWSFVEQASAAEGVRCERRSLARFDPVQFDSGVVDLVERTAGAHGLSFRRMPSGAGHDAQILARLCPTGMIFVPSFKGLSHNVAEYTAPDDLVAGAAVLLEVLTALADRP
ncbi:MAG: hydantoinase/carbamoylase family amidase, partial [Betaproteobacteria bacterium]